MKLSTTLFCLVLHLHLFGQWEPMNGPFGGSISTVRYSDPYLFTSSSDGLYRSIDNGETWSNIIIEDDLLVGSLFGVFSNQVIIATSKYIAGVQHKSMYRSEDFGDSWIEIQRPTQDGLFYFAIVDSLIYVADHDSLWYSIDGGNSYVVSSLQPETGYILGLDVFDNNIYVNLGDQTFISTGIVDEFIETNWQEATGSLSSFYKDGSIILAAGYDGQIHSSTDGGENWIFNEVEVNDYTDYARLGDSYFINSNTTIFRSDDSGVTWQDVNTTGFDELNHTLVGVNGNLVTGGFTRGIAVSKDLGQHFEISNAGIASSHVRVVFKHKDKLLTGVDYHGIVVYEFLQSRWDTIPKVQPERFISDFAFYNGKLFAAAGKIIYSSTDEGNTWSIVDTLQENYGELKFYHYENESNSYLLAAGIPRMYISNEDGTKWEPFVIQTTVNLMNYARGVVQNGHTHIAITYDSIFRSTDNGLSWQPAMNGFTIANFMGDGLTDLYEINGTFFALEDAGYFFTLTTNLYASYDDGETWQLTENGLPVGEYKGIRSLANFNDALIASMVQSDDQVYISFDNGISWQPFSEGLPFRHVDEIFADEAYLYAATSGHGVYRRKISDLQLLSTKNERNSNGANTMEVFPNPNNGSFTVKIPERLASGKINLINSLGLHVSSHPFTNKDHEIEGKFFPAGTYLVQVTDGVKQYTTKIIILP